MLASDFTQLILLHDFATVNQRKDSRQFQNLTCDPLRNTVSCLKRGSRLSGVLHVLLHMTRHEGPLTSEHLAKAMDSNPVVIRRIMAGLRDQGYVHSEKGHGGGWSLCCDLSEVTLRDVYTALGSPALLAIGNRTEAPKCLIEQAVNGALNKSFEDAEQLLLARLQEVTLEMLTTDVQRRITARKRRVNRRRD